MAFVTPHSRSTLTVAAAFCALLFASDEPALAEVSAAELARLGGDLTPVGAERAGNADGSIPAWSGAIPPHPDGWQPGDVRVNPFAGEAPLFSIGRDNIAEHADEVSPGQAALIKRLDGYRLDVYPSRRLCSYPERVYEGTKLNANRAAISEDGDLIEGIGGFLFPFPASGEEVIWNHKARYRGDALLRYGVAVVPTTAGDYVPVIQEDEIYVKYHRPEYTSLAQLDNVGQMYINRLVGPPRVAGSIRLAHDTVNGPREVWVYNPGQRRLRRAPDSGYDVSIPESQGLAVGDQIDGYNGDMDRYDWQLLGKREMYIPYNAYEVNATQKTLDDVITPYYIKREVMRYELHRVWVVEARLKPEKRHIYARRVKYVDEDSWTMAGAELYDGRGELWRVQELPILPIAELPACVSQAEIVYDLNSDRFFTFQLPTGQPETNYLYDAPESRFTPEMVRRLGRR